jgi:hypothetical protein
VLIDFLVRNSVLDRCVREVRVYLVAAAQRVTGRAYSSLSRMCGRRFAVRVCDAIDDVVLGFARVVADCRIFGGIEYVCEHPDAAQCRKYSVSMRGGPERGGWLSDCSCACHERAGFRVLGLEIGDRG